MLSCRGEHSAWNKIRSLLYLTPFNGLWLAVDASVIGSFEIFSELTQEELLDISGSFRLASYSENQYVISSAQKRLDVYFVISGLIRVCAFSEQGKQVQFEDLGSGKMFGEMSAIDGGERSGDCISIIDSEVAILSVRDFHRLMADYPQVSLNVSKRLVGLVRMHMARVYEFSTSTVSQRVRFELLRMASSNASDNDEDIVVLNPPTHSDIAARISTHREAVTRELKNLEASGVITWRPGRHIVHNLKRLTETS